MVLKWWERLFKKKVHEPQVNAVEDIEAVGEFMLSADKDCKAIIKLLEELEELERERHVASSGVLQVNLNAQAELLEELLGHYADFQNDVDINGLRIKKVAKHFLREAEKAGLKDLVKDKKHDPRWMFWW